MSEDKSRICELKNRLELLRLEFERDIRIIRDDRDAYRERLERIGKVVSELDLLPKQCQECANYDLGKLECRLCACSQIVRLPKLICRLKEASE